MYTYTYCVSGQPQNVDPEFSRNGPGLRQAKGIASKGFRVGQAKHGRRFGDGVYLAEDLAKSLAYCNRGGWTADLEKSWKIPKNGRAWHYNILYSSLFIFIHLYSFICSSIFYLSIYLFFRFLHWKNGGVNLQKRWRVTGVHFWKAGCWRPWQQYRDVWRFCV